MDEGELVRRLVDRYSPSGREGAAVHEFVAAARELGYETHIDSAGNGVARRGRGRPRVMFLGHIDTVAGKLPVRFRAGRVFGRGAVDAKGALAAALLAGAGLSGRGEYRVVAAVGEEEDSRGARYLANRARPDFVIAGEPSGWDGVTIGYKGDLQIVRSFTGRRTHYSSPAPTVADRSVEWVSAVRAMIASRARESPFRSLSAKVLEVDARRSGDVETAEVTVDFRLPPGLSTRDLERMLPGPGRVHRSTVRVRIEALELDRSNPVVAAVMEGIRAEGGRPTLWRKCGTSDLNLVLPKWCIPAAVYGPGNAHLDHTSRESISISELRHAVRVLRSALQRLQSRPPSGSGDPVGRSNASARASPASPPESLSSRPEG